MSAPTCYGAAVIHHAPGCRPGRPLCRWARKKTEGRRACFCGAVPWPHRRGYCVSGSAIRFMWGAVAPEKG